MRERPLLPELWPPPQRVIHIRRGHARDCVRFRLRLYVLRVRDVGWALAAISCTHACAANENNYMGDAPVTPLLAVE
jgi:hypothetical protein